MAYPRRTPVYTRANDHVLDAGQFFTELNGGTPFGERFDADIGRLPDDSDRARLADWERALRDDLGPLRPRPDLAVSLVLPQAGSLRGPKGNLLDRWVETAGLVAAVLAEAGAAVEIIGYTTTSWKGGASAAAWREAGRPPEPGRLCDLVHVVYKEFDTPWDADARQLFDLGARCGFVRENVDGEAYDFAAARLCARAAEARALVIFDKGQSLDDATLQANGRYFLDVDRAGALAHARAAGIALAAVSDTTPELGRAMIHPDEVRYRAPLASYDVRAAATAVLRPWLCQAG